MTSPQSDGKQNVAIAEMARDIAYIKEAISKIDARLDIMDSNYIRREEVLNLKKQADALHADHEERIRSLEKSMDVFRTQVKTWGTVGIIAIGVIEFLINIFLR